MLGTLDTQTDPIRREKISFDESSVLRKGSLLREQTTRRATSGAD